MNGHRSLAGRTALSETARKFVLVTGTVARHRLATDELGRFLEFSVRAQDSTVTICRLPIADRLGDELQSGSRYGILGHFVRLNNENMLWVRLALPLGVAHCRQPSCRRRLHPALRRLAASTKRRN